MGAKGLHDSSKMKYAWSVYRRKLKVDEDQFKYFVSVLVSVIGSDVCMPHRGRDWLNRADCKQDVKVLDRAISDVEEILRTWFWESFEKLDPFFDADVTKSIEHLHGYLNRLVEHEKSPKKWPVIRASSYGRNYFIRGLFLVHIEIFNSPLYGTIAHVWNALFPLDEVLKEGVVQICRNQSRERGRLMLCYWNKDKKTAAPLSLLPEIITKLEFQTITDKEQFTVLGL